MWDDARQMNALAAIARRCSPRLRWCGRVGRVARRASPCSRFREVVVGGPLQRASAPHLEAVIRDELAGTFFTMDLDARARVAARGCRGCATSRCAGSGRSGSRSTVEEHEPLARWNDAALVNAHGEVFVARPTTASCRRSPGRTDASRRGRRRAIASGAARSRRWRWRCSASRCRRAAAGSCGRAATAGRSTIELGRDEPAARLRGSSPPTAARWARSRARARAIDHVDLRYRNGFAARVPGFRERPPRKAGPDADAAATEGW